MPIAAIESLVSLLSFISASATTMVEFLTTIQEGIKVLKSSVANAISLTAGCDLFLRYISHSLDNPRDFDACRAHLVTHGRLFVERAKNARSQIAQYGSQVIRDGSTVLLHSYSRVVTALLVDAAEHNIRFSVLVTETSPSYSGLITAKILRKHGIPVCVIPDNAVGYIMPKVDMVLVGAEGVVENGGIINAMGTQTIAVLAKAGNTPFFALAERHKFVRLFPLNQFDLPVPGLCQGMLGVTTDDSNPFTGWPKPSEEEPTEAYGVVVMNTDKEDILADPEKDLASVRLRGKGKGSAPLVDFTKPEYISAIVSEGGFMTPSQVSEELIKIYS